MTTIGVLGAGAWGTALAIHLARSGHDVTLWAHRADHVAEMAQARCNRRYLPQAPFPETLKVSAELNDAVLAQEGVLIAVPSAAFAALLQRLKPLPRPPYLSWATKGFEPLSRRMLHQVAETVLDTRSYAVISGPTFAHEVAQGLPTALVSASFEPEVAQWWAQVLHHDLLRTYTQSDVIGVEVGGAYKNVMAIAAGVSDGLGMGANARAALIARGLAEMIRFGTALGGEKDTFMGLTGVGDLVLTCTDDQSRNRRFGKLLARSPDVAAAQRQIGQVVEGARAVDTIRAIAEDKQLELPIAEQVYAVLQGQCPPLAAVRALFERDLKAEKVI
ncbi:MAG TPA: NAD(P)-dependent glycerol-3-phosphate dehydrogenase [Piscirickettsiaceae bacterium]|nr:NAD(P)-dependent glycerol-3-phosphate dehydrogenase [Piscirickettsiaceae bacterium]